MKTIKAIRTAQTLNLENYMAFNFEKLRVWQMSIELASDVYDLSLKFPTDQRFNLTSQINRAADSMSLNIAEGSTGQSTKEFHRFLGLSLRSGIEVVGCLYLGRKKRFISNEDFDLFYSKTEKLIVMIQALRRSLRNTSVNVNREP
jgi:four helix bundle protein